MPAQTQVEISEQMVAQLRLLKPSISAEVGTPERLIIDTVAKAQSESAVDLVGLEQALNIDSKFGVNLNNFLAVFGFARQQATTAKGFVIFSRNAAANIDILIPAGTVLKANPNAFEVDGTNIEFITTSSITLPSGELETALCPVRAVQSGSIGNVPANAITIMSLAPVLGITGVTNPSPTTGGQDQEDDNSLKVRFKNTVFRNLAGTEDQFLALALSTTFTKKANVIGPVSRYKEYVQVPEKQDSETFEGFPGRGSAIILKGDMAEGSKFFFSKEGVLGVQVGQKISVYASDEEVVGPVAESTISAIDEGKSRITVKQKTGASAEVVEGYALIGEPLAAVGFENQWTTALSDNPFIKDVWTTLPVFVSNTNSGISKYFFRSGVDYEFNFPAKLQGDSLRALLGGSGLNTDSIEGKTRPNITFKDVYEGIEPEAVTALAPGSIVLIEYAYTSSSSRNSLEHNVTNAVDVYVDGVNEQTSTTTFGIPLSATASSFKDDPNSPYYYENYRRKGEPSKRPLEGNVLTTLFQVPVLSIPSQIVIEDSKYYLGTHYWAIQDTGEYAGTVRARDGIEWNLELRGDKGHSPEGIPTEANEEPEYTGERFADLITKTVEEPKTPVQVTIENYNYDQNILELQAAYEGARQVTTDALAHKARTRYFKLDVTVVYAAQATPSSINEAIQSTLEAFFSDQFFGSVMRLSDLLQVVHGVQGVENVRWSNNKPNDEIAVYETDAFGKPLHGVTLDRLKWGNTTESEIQALYIAGDPRKGEFLLKAESSSEYEDIFNVTASDVKRRVEESFGLTSKGACTVVEDVRSTVGVVQPLQSFHIYYSNTGTRELPVAVENPEDPISEDEYSFSTDFFLRDDELPSLPETVQEGDTLPGLIIRPRAQNVWQKTRA